MRLSEIAKSMRLPDRSIVRFRSTKFAPGAKRMFKEDEGVNVVSARRKGKEIGFLQTQEADRLIPTGSDRGYRLRRSPRGEIAMTRVAQPYQRKGVATQMVRVARHRGFNPRRSPIVTAEGRAFARSFPRKQ